MSFLNSDGSLILQEWAQEEEAVTRLHVDGSHLREHPMHGSTATGDSLVGNGDLGADLIRVPAGGGFAPHTHPGDHLLIVVAGFGTITYDGKIYPTKAGQIYMVEGETPHAVGAITNHCILAVGAPHRPIDSADRMTLVDHAAVAAEMGNLTCLICHVSGTSDRLRDQGCEHAPVAAPGGRPVVVGIAPATPDLVGSPAFLGSRSGTRLAGLIGCELDQLLDRVDTANLFSDYVDDWQEIPADAWRLAGDELAPSLSGRVVVACGKRVARSLGHDSTTWGSVQLVDPGAGKPYMVMLFPHPSGLSRVWNDPEVSQGARLALSVARTLASAGAPGGAWVEKDARALEAISLPALVKAHSA